jgi:hypothetical protein
MYDDQKKLAFVRRMKVARRKQSTEESAKADLEPQRR